MISKLTNDPVATKLLEGFKNSRMFEGDKKELISFLEDTGDTEAGRYVQDTIFKDTVVTPAKELARKNGISDPASIAQVVDHAANVGLSGATAMIRAAAGNYTSKNLVSARRIQYNQLIKRYPKLASKKKEWSNRLEDAEEAFEPMSTGSDSVANRVARSARAKEFKKGVSKPTTPDIKDITPTTIAKATKRDVTRDATSPVAVNTSTTAPKSSTDMKEFMNTYTSEAVKTRETISKQTNSTDMSIVEEALIRSVEYLEGITNNTASTVKAVDDMRDELNLLYNKLSGDKAPKPKHNTVREIRGVSMKRSSSIQ